MHAGSSFSERCLDQLIHTQLSGKALKVFAELSVEECMDFEVLKKALLLAFDRVPEFHRKRFRTLSKANGESYSNFAFRLALPFKSWMDGEEAYDNVDRMREVVKLEQFVNCLPLELHRWVVERKPKTVADAARLADEYAALYKPLRWSKPQTKSWSMFQFRSMTEVTLFKIPGRGVGLPKELI